MMTGMPPVAVVETNKEHLAVWTRSTRTLSSPSLSLLFLWPFIYRLYTFVNTPDHSLLDMNSRYNASLLNATASASSHPRPFLVGSAGEPAPASGLSNLRQ